jgi:hypothetical protein
VTISIRKFGRVKGLKIIGFIFDLDQVGEGVAITDARPKFEQRQEGSALDTRQNVLSQGLTPGFLHVDPGRLPGRADPGDRLHVRRAKEARGISP